MHAQKILIVEVNWLGDVLFSTPFIRAVRNNFPDAYIACMVAPRCVEILEGNPNINDIIIYDEDGAHKGLFGKIWFAIQLKKRCFDTVFFLHRSFTRAILAYLAGIPQRIGYYTPKRAFLLTDRFKPAIGNFHRAKFYLNLLEAVELKTDDKGCDFFIDSKDTAWADEFLKRIGVKATDKIIVFNPGGNWPPKRWPAGNFAMLAEKMLASFRGAAKILISGSKKDLKLAEDIQDKAGQNLIILCGQATLKQTAAIFKKADVVISGDSGPLHIAVSVGAKVIGLFGPTSTSITGPYMADDRKLIILQKDIIRCKIPCYSPNCHDYGCMSAITAEEVFEAVKKIVG